jgi:hypothetical protein
VNRERRGRHEAGLPSIDRDHATVRDQARASLISHLGYQPRHRKSSR